MSKASISITFDVEETPHHVTVECVDESESKYATTLVDTVTNKAMEVVRTLKAEGEVQIQGAIK